MTDQQTSARPFRAAGRGWAYVGAVLGGVVSVAANVAHSYVPPTDLPPAESAAWSPPAGAVVAAVFWPVALLVAVEILARTAWPSGTRWAVLRYAGLLPVALVAAVVSYRHLSGLIAYYGEPGLTALVGPLAVDGLMVMATGALIATAHTTTTVPRVAATAPQPADAGSSPLPSRADEVPTQNPQNPQNPRTHDHEPAAPAGSARRSGPRKAASTPAARTPAVDVAELVPLGREIADRLAAQGRTLTRAALREEFRTDGRALSNARAGHLLALLKTDHTANDRTTTNDQARTDRTDDDRAEDHGPVRTDGELLMEAS